MCMTHRNFAFYSISYNISYNTCVCWNLHNISLFPLRVGFHVCFFFLIDVACNRQFNRIFHFCTVRILRNKITSVYWEVLWFRYGIVLYKENLQYIVPVRDQPDFTKEIPIKRFDYNVLYSGDHMQSENQL